MILTVSVVMTLQIVAFGMCKMSLISWVNGMLNLDIVESLYNVVGFFLSVICVIQALFQWNLFEHKPNFFPLEVIQSHSSG